jgi:hypothetical protein
MEYFLGGVAAVLGGGRCFSAIGAYLVESKSPRTWRVRIRWDAV